MKVVLQRVSKATVTVQTEIKGEIGVGYLLLVGFTAKDGPSEVIWLAEKIVGYEIKPVKFGIWQMGCILCTGIFPLYKI